MIIRSVDFDLVRKFLMLSGFEKRDCIPGHSDLWRHPVHIRELILPNCTTPVDYREATMIAINKLINWGYFGENFEYLLMIDRMQRIEREMHEMVKEKPEEFYIDVKW